MGRHTAHGVATEAKEAVVEGVGQIGAHVLGHNLNCMVLYTHGRPCVDRLGDEEEGKREMAKKLGERKAHRLIFLFLLHVCSRFVLA